MLYLFNISNAIEPWIILANVWLKSYKNYGNHLLTCPFYGLYVIKVTAQIQSRTIQPLIQCLFV